MNFEKTISAFARLGTFLQSEFPNPQSKIHKIIAEAEIKNKWFTPANTLFALNSIAENLTEENLTGWIIKYPRLTSHISHLTSKKIGVILAGNLPLVGFHDFLCVLMSGNIFVGKQSSQDNILLKFLSDKLIGIDKEFEKKIFFTEKLEGIDAVIATGSNNTNRYFEYYFGKLPHIFRKNRNSVAILTGSERPADIELLADDIFLYFGLGCRNVSKLFIPEGYDFHKFFPHTEKYSSHIHHHKYANNYNYYRTIYAMNNLPFFDNGFLVLKEDANFASPVAIIFFEYYKNISDVFQKLEAVKEDVQCVAVSEEVKKKNSESLSLVSFGKTQHPVLHDYADNVDTMEFLMGL